MEGRTCEGALWLSRRLAVIIVMALEGIGILVMFARREWEKLVFLKMVVLQNWIKKNDNNFLGIYGEVLFFGGCLFSGFFFFIFVISILISLPNIVSVLDCVSI